MKLLASLKAEGKKTAWLTGKRAILRADKYNFKKTDRIPGNCKIYETERAQTINTHTACVKLTLCIFSVFNLFDAFVPYKSLVLVKMKFYEL